MSGFRGCGGKGFHIQFPNGLTLSTQFGAGNYADNYDDRDYTSGKDKESSKAEVAVFSTDGKKPWCTQEIAKAAGLADSGDDVIGYVSFDDWLKLFDACRGHLAH